MKGNTEIVRAIWGPKPDLAVKVISDFSKRSSTFCFSSVVFFYIEKNVICAII